MKLDGVAHSLRRGALFNLADYIVFISLHHSNHAYRETCLHRSRWLVSEGYLYIYFCLMGQGEITRRISGAWLFDLVMMGSAKAASIFTMNKEWDECKHLVWLWYLGVA